METYSYLLGKLSGINNPEKEIPQLLLDPELSFWYKGILFECRDKEQVVGKMIFEYVGDEILVYVTSLKILKPQWRSCFQVVPDSYVWNLFFLPQNHRYEGAGVEWRYLLLTPKEDVGDIPHDIWNRHSEAKLWAVKMTDWLFTGYNGGEIDVYSKMVGGMLKERSILLFNHSKKHY